MLTGDAVGFRERSLKSGVSAVDRPASRTVEVAVRGPGQPVQTLPSQTAPSSAPILLFVSQLQGLRI